MPPWDAGNTSRGWSSAVRTRSDRPSRGRGRWRGGRVSRKETTTMMTSMRAKRFVGLGLLGVALACGGAARAQQDDGPERSIQEQLRRLQQLIPDQEVFLDPGLG